MQPSDLQLLILTERNPWVEDPVTDLSLEYILENAKLGKKAPRATGPPHSKTAASLNSTMPVSLYHTEQIIRKSWAAFTAKAVPLNSHLETCSPHLKTIYSAHAKLFRGRSHKGSDIVAEILKGARQFNGEPKTQPQNTVKYASKQEIYLPRRLSNLQVNGFDKLSTDVYLDLQTNGMRDFQNDPIDMVLVVLIIAGRAFEFQVKAVACNNSRYLSTFKLSLNMCCLITTLLISSNTVNVTISYIGTSIYLNIQKHFIWWLSSMYSERLQLCLLAHA